MKRKLLNKKEHPPACAYCHNGRLSPDGCTVLCPGKGIMSPTAKCRHFSYDPLRRIPQATPGDGLIPCSDEDFSL